MDTTTFGPRGRRVKRLSRGSLPSKSYLFPCRTVSHDEWHIVRRNITFVDIIEAHAVSDNLCANPRFFNYRSMRCMSVRDIVIVATMLFQCGRVKPFGLGPISFLSNRTAQTKQGNTSCSQFSYSTLNFRVVGESLLTVGTHSTTLFPLLPRSYRGLVRPQLLRLKITVPTVKHPLSFFHSYSAEFS